MSYLKTLFIICPIFFISGIIDSIGGGGGLIALPTYLMIGLPVRSAYGCNKLQAGLGNLVSAIKYFKNNMVDLRIALVSAITAMTGAWIGTKIIFLLPEESIQKAITVALPVIALIMVLRKTDARNVIMRSEISKKTVIQALIVGVITGIVYASGVILKEVRSGEMSRHDVFSCMTLMGLAHAIIEDTCLMLLIGAHIGGIFFLRLALAFVTCAMINILYLRFRGDAREPETAPNEVS